MEADFSEVTSKLNWSRHQLMVLQLAITDYIDLEPYVADVEDDSEAQAYRLIARLRYPPPPGIAHIIGDVLTNLHGVLDYLAWQLVIREGEVPDLQTAFPIKTPNKDGTEPGVNIYRTPDGKGRGQVPVIKDETVLALLRNVQPYREGDRASFHWLEILRVLNRESKHRHPVVLAAASVGTSVMSGGRRIGSIDDTLSINFRRIDDGDELAIVPYADAPEGCNPEQATFAPQIALEGVPVTNPEGPPPEALTILSAIYEYIADQIVSRFSLLF
jgi:hypothetical protein